MAEVFISNLPNKINENSLKKALTTHLQRIGIYAFTPKITKGMGGPQAFLTLPNAELARAMVLEYGEGSRIKITIKNKKLIIRYAYNPPRDIYMVLSLVEQQKKEAEKRTRVTHSDEQLLLRRKATKDGFPIIGFACGAWAMENPDNTLHHTPTIFNPRYQVYRSGTIQFQPQSIEIDFEDPNEVSSADDLYGSSANFSMRIFNHTIREVCADGRNNIYLHLHYAPRFYVKRRHTDMLLGERLTRDRVVGMDSNHEAYTGFSFVYRIMLSEARHNSRIVHLASNHGLQVSSKTISPIPASMPFVDAFLSVMGQIQDYSTFPYRCAFQVHALVSNGFLPPETVLTLLPEVKRLIRRAGEVKSAAILREFVADHINYSVDGILDLFNEHVASLKEWTDEYIAEEKEKHVHQINVHRVSVTPTGVFCYGPSWEASNRVLREYSEHQDYFLRVIFCEEDGDRFQYEFQVNSSKILQGQFLKRLDPKDGGALVIAGRKFEFLGFSSSSLKSQTCWYMAPFWHNGKYMTSEEVIKSLGDFSDLRNPGRFAARVGQAFSDTIGSATVEVDDEVVIDDIERYDSSGKKRNFTDGIGKISFGMVERIWQTSERIAQLRPTVFQIRYAGAKGMIALDPSLPGTKICLRKSMIKFGGSTSRTIELCTWAKNLPMFLNRPLIKLLEDLGVKKKTFMDLQTDAIDRLREASRSTLQAAHYLKTRGISSPSLRLPFIFESLRNLQVNYWEDPFLRHAFELSLLMELNDIKYRARIPVKQGLTLVGVVDETGYLQEGEVYVNREDENQRPWPLIGRVLVTRSPVHHPGDVQIVYAVDIPDDSPLRLLRNTVVFSQNGDRPLPSMLSGGDLDGDLYNIIYDERFILPKNQIPADYPSVNPVKLNRPITASDVANFFVEFIENDLVGLISTRHLMIADQKPQGVFDPDCLKLAEMASVAVDFPKSGHKVDRRQFPRSSRAKPDFLAPGPRVLTKLEKIQYEEFRGGEDEDEFISQQPYYASPKILGNLYRAVNEEEFLQEIRRDLSAVNGTSQPKSLVKRLYEYFENTAETFGVKYNIEDWIQEAAINKAEYTNSITTLQRDFSDTPWTSSLSEAEVFVGIIIGTKNKQSKRNRDNAEQMKEEFHRLVESWVEYFKTGTREEVVGRAMACLRLEVGDGEGMGRSWAWILVGVLLGEVDWMQREMGKRRRRVYAVGSARGGRGGGKGAGGGAA